jgi:SNF2 family DNA or RNA helicase
MLQKHSTMPSTKESFDRHFGENGLKTLLKKALECSTLYYAPSSSDPEYPSISTQVVEVAMTRGQRKAQVDFAKKSPNILLEDVLRQKKNVMTFFSGPRRVANVLRKKGKLTDAPRFVEALGRIKTAHAKGEKSIAYNNFLEVGVNLLADLLKDAHVKFMMVTGKESKAKKQEAIDQFNKGTVKVLLLSAAGGEGHDLRGTNHVHIMEPAFNSPRLEQVIGRARRRGSHVDSLKKVTCMILRRLSENKDDITRRFLQKVLEWNTSAKARCLQC